MFKLAHVTEAYEEAASFNEQINLFGFIDDQVFGGGSGGVLVDEGFVERDEFGDAFVSKADRFGDADGVGERAGNLRAQGSGETMASCVGGGAGFALGRDRPLGFFPVGTGGAALAAGGHGLDAPYGRRGFRCGSSVHGDF